LFLFNWSSFLELLQAVWLPQTRTFADKRIKFLTGQMPYLLAKQLSKKERCTTEKCNDHRWHKHCALSLLWNIQVNWLPKCPWIKTKN